MLSLAVWGKLPGFLGLLLAIPNTVLVLAYYEKYLKKSEEERGESGTDPPELIDP
ncbi:MAG: hypothetical protein U5N86_12090 [Planctomycetota bacterium]|nr:hypothetical protein [Planctomycetota bacterium]